MELLISALESRVFVNAHKRVNLHLFLQCTDGLKSVRGHWDHLQLRQDEWNFYLKLILNRE